MGDVCTIPCIIIYSGFFTVTEAASVTVVYVILIESLIYKDLSITKDIPLLMRDSIILVGSILIILVNIFLAIECAHTIKPKLFSLI